MAKRQFNGKSIYDEDWSWATRDVFFWLLGVGANGFGLQRERPRMVAEGTHRPVRHVMEAIETLIEDGTLLRYESGAGAYLAFTKWQEHQRVKYPGDCGVPPPPPDVFRKLSRETQKLFRKHAEVFPDYVAVAVAVDVADAVAVAEGPPREKPSATAPAACGWCEAPCGEKAPNVKRLVQAYHDAYRERNGTCPVVTKACFGIAAGILKARKLERAIAVVRHGVGSTDRLMVSSGHRLNLILANFQGIEQALDRGEPHGRTDQQKTEPSSNLIRRGHGRAAAESWGKRVRPAAVPDLRGAEGAPGDPVA